MTMTRFAWDYPNFWYLFIVFCHQDGNRCIYEMMYPCTIPDDGSKSSIFIHKNMKEVSHS
jgi:hypothetical protein